MKKATPAQIQKFHALLNQQGLMEHKKDLVSEFTDGKQTSTKEMTLLEMINAIEHLEANASDAPTKPKIDTALDKQRKKIIGLCREMKMEVEKNGKTVADMPKIYAFIKQKGSLKKDLNEYTSEELSKLIPVIEKIKKYVTQKNEDKNRSNWTVTNTETGEIKTAKDILKT
jgi:ATP-dependent helicase YprA (DUF1998 family)